MAITLAWSDFNSTILVSLTDGSVLEFTAKSWNRARIREQTYYHEDEDELITPNIYNTLNRYLETLPVNIVSNIETIYKTIYNDMQMEYSLIDLNKLLNRHIYVLFSYIDWNHFVAWMYEHGNQNTAIGVKDILNETDSALLTYFTKDYEELVFFSVYIKLIMPIWGMYCNLMEGLLGPERILIQAVDLIENEIILNNPAYLRLKEHVNNFIKANLKSKAYTITADIGSSEVPDYMLAIAMWKKIILFDGKTKNGSIIKNLHAILKDRCARLEKAGPRQKTSKGESKKGGSDDISIVDTYKIISPIPMGMVAIISAYLNMGRIQNHIHENVTIERVNSVLNSIPNNFELLGYHIPISSWVMDGVIGCRNLHLLDHLDDKRVMAITSAVLHELEFHSIAELLVDVPDVKDPRIISSGKYILPVTNERILTLTNMYKFTGNINHGLALIHNVVNIMAGYDWHYNKGNLESIANELADMMILIDSRK